MQKKTTIQEKMRKKLENEFSPSHLKIFDESYKHAGHVGAPKGSSETHIGIIIVSDIFNGMSRIERARAVHKTIAEEIKNIHALTVLKTITPEEFSVSGEYHN